MNKDTKQYLGIIVGIILFFCSALWFLLTFMPRQETVAKIEDSVTTEKNTQLVADSASNTTTKKVSDIEILSVYVHSYDPSPEVEIEYKNNTDNPIDAIEFNVFCYDNFNEPVYDISGSNVTKVISQKVLMPHDSVTNYWALHLHDHTTKVKVSLSRFHKQ